MALTQGSMHKSSGTIEIIWRKWNWWSIGKIARRRWSISSCRHIFALRQKVKKNHRRFLYQLIRFSLYVYVLQSFGWYGVIVWRYRYHYVPFSFPFAFFLRLLRFFFCSPSILLLLWSGDVWWTYINIRMYVFFLYMTRCHSGIYVIYSYEEITLLCVQANDIYTVSSIVDYT